MGCNEVVVRLRDLTAERGLIQSFLGYNIIMTTIQQQ